MSRCLTDRSIDHVVLERAQVANAWRTERWDSLRLLTPNWQTRLPGSAYEGDDPDGFMPAPEVAAFIAGYARSIRAPVQTDTTVASVRRGANGYRVRTNRGDWDCRTVVLATGGFNAPHLPDFAAAVPRGVTTLTPMEYRNPGQLAEGGVLVVGASATGVQIASEIQRSGRGVTLAVGEHVRGPRLYRGRDIHWWMETAGVLDERYDEVDDIARARRVPSMQLGGSPERASFDLNSLSSIGVRLVGRLAGIRDGCAQFSGSLHNNCALADLKLGRLLDTLDHWAIAARTADELPAPYRLPPTALPESPPLCLDLTRGEVETIIWATGFRPDYSWLDVPVLDDKGMVRHDGGVVESPGLYLIGLPFLRRRKSSFIDGARRDAQDLVLELSAFLDRGADADEASWRHDRRQPAEPPRTTPEFDQHQRRAVYAGAAGTWRIASLANDPAAPSADRRRSSQAPHLRGPRSPE
jgi:putative flavoprotein involved in K+ transport